MERRRSRVGLRVIHRHRVGRFVFARASELVFVNGQPRAVLGWINFAGVRTPLYICELERSKLRQPQHGPRNTFYYDDVTVDPRYSDYKLPPGA